MITAAIAKVEETARAERLEPKRNHIDSGRVAGCKTICAGRHPCCGFFP